MEALEELDELFSSKNEITDEALRNKLWAEDCQL